MTSIWLRTKLWLRAWWRLNSHRLAHLFGWNGGNPEVWTARNGRLIVGFRCHGCGKLFHIEPCRRSMQPEEHR